MTTIFIVLVGLIWLRLLAVTILALHDHLSRLRPQLGTRLEPTKMAEVTILVPAYQESSTLELTIESIKVAVAAGAHLIIVDDGSTDGTDKVAQAIVNSLGVGRIISHGRNLGKPAALNAGLAAVVTPYVLTLDGDTMLTDGALEAALAMLVADAAHLKLSSIAFDISVRPSDHWLSEIQGIEYDASLNFERRGQSVINAVSVSPGAASLWRTFDLVEAGGFSADTATEDVDVTLLLASRGKRSRHCPLARAYTEPPKSFQALMAQRRRWSYGHYQNISRHAGKLGRDKVFTWLTYPNFFALSAFLPTFLLLSVATLLAERGVWQRNFIAATVLWLITAYVQRWLALRLARRSFTAAKFAIEPFATQLIHICALVLVILTAIRARQGAKTDIWK